MLGDPFLPAVSIPHSGGYNVDSLELLEFMVTQKEWRCIVITNKSDYIPDDEQQMSENIKIHRLIIPEKYLKDQNLIPEYYPQILKDVERILKLYGDRIDLIHSFYWLSGRAAYDLNKKYHFPYVHSVVSLSSDKITCNETPNCYLQFEWKKELFESAYYILTITDAEQRSLTEIYGIDPKKIVIVGRGVNKAFEFPIHTPDGIPTKLADTLFPKSKQTTTADF